jgi:hypothetical protein
MATETNPPSPEIDRKLELLSKLIIERNSVIEILGEIQRKKSTLSDNVADILIHKFQSKISLIDKQMSQIAAGLQCTICSEILAVNDDIIPCLWCGSPAHMGEYLTFVKHQGRCPSCGEYLKFHFKGSMKTISYDLLRYYMDGLSDKIHELEISFGDKPLEEVVAEDKLFCPACKQRISPNWNFCRICGNRLNPKMHEKMQMPLCPRCGKQIKNTWQHCKWCGYTLTH